VPTIESRTPTTDHRRLKIENRTSVIEKRSSKSNHRKAIIEKQSSNIEILNLVTNQTKKQLYEYTNTRIHEKSTINNRSTKIDQRALTNDHRQI
jgi:hypothetical protein